MSSPGPQLTPQQRAQLPHEDKAHVLLGAHWGLTALATVFLGLRVYCKRVTGRRLLWDDWILIASLVRAQFPSSHSHTLIDSKLYKYIYGYG